MVSNGKEISEFRQDPVSHDWVIISTGRAKRPESYKLAQRQSHETPLDICPFEDPRKSGNEAPLLVYKGKSGQDWAVQVFRNKFPIVVGAMCGIEKPVGPYNTQLGAGYHEVVVTRDHWRSLAQMGTEEVEQVIKAYKERYLSLRQADCAKYILINHNHGREAGASVSHPHSQILAIPFIPNDIRRSLDGSQRYFQERRRCVHCDVIHWERAQKIRIVFENETMIVLVPFVPKFSFEIRIFPKQHQPYFEQINEFQERDFAEALQIALAKVYHGLNDIAYNFFVHTPPAHRAHEYDYYHWHLEINPRSSVWGGFELGTGGEIIEVNPDDAAEHFRNIKI